jgi:hypothetical protein
MVENPTANTPGIHTFQELTKITQVHSIDSRLLRRPKVHLLMLRSTLTIHFSILTTQTPTQSVSWQISIQSPKKVFSDAVNESGLNKVSEHDL